MVDWAASTAYNLCMTISAFDSRRTKTCALVPFRDPWQAARPRWWDINDQPLSNFLQNGQFVYNHQQIVLSYNVAPAVPYFVGHIAAQGLKPNFAYQMKLAGKPQYGERGWGQYGDDAASERLGQAGRWWDDSCLPPGPNLDDAYYAAHYQCAGLAQRRTIYGYLYLGAFVTDEQGNANLEVASCSSYHICWQDKQTHGQREVVAGTYSIQSLQSPYYGYGHRVEPETVRLWYEYQAGRAREVGLPGGTYNCRFMITEETFHNLMGGMDDPQGGFYQSVLATEDFNADGKPDSNPDNDVVFTISQ